jgi:type II secretory pathway pseudopilin PulG
MSTGAIIAIIVVAILIVAVFAIALPRMRANARERELAQRRNEVAGAHRDRASDRLARAEEAEHIAARERADAELHESRARLHERGLADDQLDDEHDRLGGARARERDDDERFARDEADSTVPPEERTSRW